MKNMFMNLYNVILNKKTTFKCMVYLYDESNKSGKLFDAMEIEETTMKRAYKFAYKTMKLKYPDSGLDIRIYKNK